MILDTDTVEEVLKRMHGTPTANSLKWALLLTMEQRYDLLESILESTYGRLIASRQVLPKAKTSEDQLSVQIINMLGSFGISAHHDVQDGGHVDIHVEGPPGSGFLWIGEAKIWDGPKYIEGGFLQLSTRYGTAMDGRDRGG